MQQPAKAVVVYIDGGARGNPGPAGAGVVIQAADDATVLFEAGYFIGRATNNVAEYSALTKGLARARALVVEQVEIRSDSELLVRQMRGEYRVKSERLGELFAQANRLCKSFKAVRFTHVPRELNRHADQLVNRAINLKSDVEDAQAGP